MLITEFILIICMCVLYRAHESIEKFVRNILVYVDIRGCRER